MRSPYRHIGPYRTSIARLNFLPLNQGFDESSVVLDEHVAESWLAEARKIPGWESGPEFAPHPTAVRPVDDDEAVDV